MAFQVLLTQRQPRRRPEPFPRRTATMTTSVTSARPRLCQSPLRPITSAHLGLNDSRRERPVLLRRRPPARPGRAARVVSFDPGAPSQGPQSAAGSAVSPASAFTQFRRRRGASTERRYATPIRFLRLLRAAERCANVGPRRRRSPALRTVRGALGHVSPWSMIAKRRRTGASASSR